MKTDSALQCLELRKQMSLKSFAKSRSRMNVSDVGDLVTNTVLGPHIEKARFPNWVRVRTTKAALVMDERSWRRPDFATLNCTMLLRYAGVTPALVDEE